MGRLTSCAAIVLCGGESRRMGQPKASLKLGDRTFLETVVDTVGEVCGPVVVVKSPGQALPTLPVGVQVVCDTIAHRGPLNGMLAGFSAISGRAEFAYVSGTDTPLLKSAVIEMLRENVEGHDMAIPFDGCRHHPLAGIYRVSKAKADAESLLAADRHRPFFLMENARCVEVPFERFRQVDPRLESFRNINTPADYRAILQEHGEPVPAGFRAPSVSIEFYGVARTKTGIDRATIEAETVGELIAVLASEFPDLIGSVIIDGQLHPAYMLMRGTTERLFGDTATLKESDTLLLLNLDAGG